MSSYRDVTIRLEPHEPWTGCTCAACGAQWPDTPPADGAPVYCDGLCAAQAEAAARHRNQKPSAGPEEARRGGDDLASLRRHYEDYPELRQDLRPFDVPRDQL
jgi:hypothetical protein